MTSALRLDWLDRLPTWVWLALPVAALTPIWLWCAARVLDRSDDPLGIVALVALGVLVVREREHFMHEPRPGWLVVATLLAAAAILPGAAMPALFRGVIAVLCVCAALMAIRARGQPMLALAGLALLALPLLSSLQFYIGYPLRVVTAEASRWLLLAGGIAAERSGSALEIAGRLVMVDAPCSGIQMGWVAYFTACVAGAWLRIPDGRFLTRIPLIGLTVLAGNIARNTLLVIKEAKLAAWPDCAHEAIGVIAFAAVASVVLWHVRGAARDPAIAFRVRGERMIGARARSGSWTRLFVLGALSLLTLWPWLQPNSASPPSTRASIEWPRELDGRALRPLALSTVEQRFADRFPGAIGRFTDGERSIVIREVTAPTRMLHPATDCYRGLGYRVLTLTLEQRAQNNGAPSLARCFVAEKNGERIRVCENIVDARGQTFSDTSAWYWAAVLGRSSGPWRAVTQATRL